MKNKDVIQRISYYRTKAKISARELSLMIGKAESYINRLESSEFNLPVPVLLEIIEALEITESEFFSENYLTYKTDKELLDLIKTLPQDKRTHMIEFIKK